MLRLAKAESKEIKTVYFISLLLLLGTGEDDVVGKNIDFSSASNKAERIRIFCECNYMKRVGLKDASRHIGMNVSSFCKFFLRNFGCTFTEYINRLRISESCRRLKVGSDYIAEIAYSVGFTSVPYFNRVFRDQCGLTPSQYRMKNN